MINLMKNLGYLESNLSRKFLKYIIEGVRRYFLLPSSISFTLSNKCNLRCSFCPKTIYGVEEKQMNEEILKSIIKLAKNIKRVQILGLGEPLINSNFLETVNKLKANGAAISFTTNGILLNETISKELCQKSVDKIIFSIQGVKKETHGITKGSELDKMIANIRKINLIKREMRQETPKLSFGFVGMTNNIGELPEVIKLAHQVGVKNVYVGNVMPLNKNTCNYHLHKNPQIASYYIKEAEKMSNKMGIAFTTFCSLSPYPTYCHWHNRPHIGLEGDVYPCNFIGSQDSLKSPKTIWYEDVPMKIDVHKFRLGNIQSEKLKRIWNNKKIKALRSIIYKSLKEDRKFRWSPEAYKNLILKHRGKELTPEEFCSVCPHRFRITH